MVDVDNKKLESLDVQNCSNCKDAVLIVKDFVTKQMNLNEKFVELQGMACDTHKMLLLLVLSLRKTIKIILFILGFLIWNVFLLEPVGWLIRNFITSWYVIPENYRDSIINLLGLLVVGVLAQVVGNLITSKFVKKD